jgi:fructan beta-fructosidase
VDWKNTSGFGKDGNPPLVAIYTGHHPRNNMEEQCIAYSNDKGRTWTKFAGNPVISLGNDFRDFRDPKVHWNEQRKWWVMTVAMAAERKIRFYSSPDLKTWSLLNTFGPAGATEGVWECPDLFELPIEGTKEKRWVLIVNVGSGSIAGGSGTQYFVGQFDGATFRADVSPTGRPLWVDYGKDFYAAVSWSDLPRTDRRRVWIGWMANTHYAGDTPTSPFRSAMSLPRELTLRQNAEGIRLVQAPARELKKLRGKHDKFGSGTVAQANEWLKKRNVAGNSLEILIETESDGLKVFKGENEETLIGKTFVDRSRSGKVDFHKAFSGRHEAPKANGPMHIFLDTCSVEVFAANGEIVFTDLVFPSVKSRGIELAGPASAKVKSLEVWELR